MNRVLEVQADFHKEYKFPSQSFGNLKGEPESEIIAAQDEAL
jgi:hypothetical protein